ncbi:MAG: zinc-ribbon domain-containing protein [Bradymonadaceae bacterium]|nr:zinc-ribbon domain-containing protein [Lujinxingiaceae bacterium]
MDVCCPQCRTVYEFDERQIRSGAVTLKCSQCQHLFRLEVPAAHVEENHRRWMVKSASSGDILYFAGFDVLHRWIMERKVQKDDAISRTGKSWKTLGTIGEFMPIFQVVESIANISSASEPMRSAVRAHTPSQPRAGVLADPPAANATAPERKRATTNPQYAAPPRQAPALAPTKPAPQPSSQPPLPPRPASGSQPSARRSSSPTPARPPSAPTPAKLVQPEADTSVTQRSAPRVRLDNSPLHRVSDTAELNRVVPPNPAQDDAWSLGDLNVGAAEQSDLGELALTPARRSKWPLIAAMVVLLGGAAYAFVGHGEQIQSWMASLSEPSVVTLGETPAVALPAKSATSPSSAAVHRAVTAAEDLTREKEIKQIREATSEAAAEVKTALPAAQDAAQQAQRPDLPSLLSTAARALERGDAERARRIYHQVIQIDSNNAEAITGLGWTLLALGSPDSAIAQFQRALHRDPNFGDGYIGLGRAERARGNLDEALRAYEGYLSRFPAGPQASIARYQSDQLRQAIGQ